jgi:hypothetical protein
VVVNLLLPEIGTRKYHAVASVPSNQIEAGSPDNQSLSTCFVENSKSGYDSLTGKVYLFGMKNPGRFN